MKKLTLILLCLALGAGIVMANDKKKEPVAPAQVTLEVDDYNSLEVSGMIRVVLEEDRDPNTILVKTEGIGPERVNARVRGGELILSLHSGKGRRGNRDNWNVTVCVSAEKLEKITCSGMSTVTSAAPLRQPAMRIDLSGMSSLKLGLECGKLDMKLSGMSTYKGEVISNGAVKIDISGMSECTVEGTAAELGLTVSGMSKFRGREFPVAGLTTCRVSGMSNATVGSDGGIKYTVDGMSNLTVIGSPQVISTSVSSSTVKHRQQ